jgi:MFS family permease
MPAAMGRRHGAAFWGVAFAFLVVMAFATLPSPLYGLYRTRDDLSTLTVTVVYAVFACGAIGALLCEHVVVGRIGRRGAMLGGVTTMMVAAAVIAVWKALPGLLVGRVISQGCPSGSQPEPPPRTSSSCDFETIRTRPLSALGRSEGR